MKIATPARADGRDVSASTRRHAWLVAGWAYAQLQKQHAKLTERWGGPNSRSGKPTKMDVGYGMMTSEPGNNLAGVSRPVCTTDKHPLRSGYRFAYSAARFASAMRMMVARISSFMRALRAALRASSAACSCGAVMVGSAFFARRTSLRAAPDNAGGERVQAHLS